MADKKALAKEILDAGLPMQGGSLALHAAAEDAKLERATCGECREWQKPSAGLVGICASNGLGVKANVVSCEWFDPIVRE